MKMSYGMYTKKVMKYFKNPKNMGRMKNPDGVGKVGNMICGDVMWLYIKVKNNKIADIKFETFGCVAAIATSSMITELVKGKTIERALKITREDIVKSLGGLPKIKIHCSVLAADALSEAIHDYLSKIKLPIPKYLSERHERIQKETEIIEERHKDYIALEKKIWKVGKK
jgi:nitrogen fixation NifU-like protein